MRNDPTEPPKSISRIDAFKAAAVLIAASIAAGRGTEAADASGVVWLQVLVRVLVAVLFIDALIFRLDIFGRKWTYSSVLLRRRTGDSTR